MKVIKLYILFITSILTTNKIIAQNAMINVMTQNAGIVKKGQTIFFEVMVINTDPMEHIGIYKIKANISVPKDTISIDTIGHILPQGWKIIKNDGANITISNGMDMIAASDYRTILIAIRGNKIGGPSILSGQLTFSDGTAPGTALGTLKNDKPQDNYSTSSCKVIK